MHGFQTHGRRIVGTDETKGAVASAPSEKYF